MKIEVIGTISSCFTEKFGIPRQPGLVTEARAFLQLNSPYNRPEMVRELERFSHLWVHFIFHSTVGAGWKPTVRPPGLGGVQRVGVLASRSPHRPNFLGLSAVQLLRITEDGNGIVLELGGGDFLDGTPVIDIKPYIHYSDSIPEATGSYGSEQNQDVEVVFDQPAMDFCKTYHASTGRDIKKLIAQVLQQDPRPASQCGKKDSYGTLLWDLNIRWAVQGRQFRVVGCEYVKSGKEKLY